MKRFNWNVDKLCLKDIYDDEDGFVQFFEVTVEFAGLIKKLSYNHIFATSIFQNSCKRNCELLQNKCELPFDGIDLPLHHLDLMNKIIKPTVNEMEYILKVIFSGEIKVASIKTLYPDHKTEKELVSEFTRLSMFLAVNTDTDQMHRCASKINCLFGLGNALGTAIRILEVAKRLELEGSFDNIKSIVEQVYFIVVFC